MVSLAHMYPTFRSGRQDVATKTRSECVPSQLIPPHYLCPSTIITIGLPRGEASLAQCRQIARQFIESNIALSSEG